MMLAVGLIAAFCVAIIMTAPRVAKASTGADLDCVDRVAWSPHKSSRNGAQVTAWVWHYTGGFGAVKWFQDPVSKVSAHFHIGRDGKITQCVPLDEVAWHAGDASPGNLSSIGVELESPGLVEKSAEGWVFNGKPWAMDEEPRQGRLGFDSGKIVDGWWVPYTEQQKAAMVRLVKAAEQSKWRPATVRMFGHEDIAKPLGRKIDPGPLFPWELFTGRRASPRTRAMV